VHIVFYVSGHGFGHASRAIELIEEIVRVRTDVRVTVRTAAPAWIFGRAPATVVEAAETDTGAAQIDSLHVDENETARSAAAFYRDFDRRVRDEADRLGQLRADLVLGDVPPLAFSAAALAGVASCAIANFTWDWIYDAYPSVHRTAPGVVPEIARAYATTTLALRLPFHGGFESMPVVRDIPLIARYSQRDRSDTRKLLGIDPAKPVALVSFGAYGVRLPLDDLRRSRDISVLAFDRDPPDGLRYEDIVAAADVVVSKPGYGIVSECAANGTPLLYTSRGHFIEYDVFVADMPRVLRCRFISNEDLLAGRWTTAILALLDQPPPPERARVDGAAIAAQEIMNLVIG
jgi:L-arabinokinase